MSFIYPGLMHFVVCLNGRHLYKKMKEENKLERFRFVDPYVVGCHFTLVDKRALGLAARLNGTPPNQLVLVPVNIGCVK